MKIMNNDELEPKSSGTPEHVPRESGNGQESFFGEDSAEMLNSEMPVVSQILKRSIVSDNVEVTMEDFEKLLGGVVCGERVYVVLTIFGSDAGTLIANATTSAFDQEVYMGRVRQNIYDSFNGDGIERFSSHNGIFFRPSNPLTQTFLRRTVDLNRETRIDSAFNGPAKSTAIKGSIALIIDGNISEIPYIEDAECHIFPIEFAPLGFNSRQWKAINELISTPEQITKFKKWVQAGAERFKGEGIAQNSLNSAMHEWRMQHDVVYRFYHRHCLRTPRKHIAIDVFMKYFRLFQHESHYHDHISQTKVTQVIRRLRHAEYVQHPPNEQSVRMHRDLSLDPDYVKTCDTNNKYRVFLDGEYDDKTWREDI